MRGTLHLEWAFWTVIVLTCLAQLLQLKPQRKRRISISITTPNGEYFTGVTCMRNISKLGVIVAVTVFNKSGVAIAGDDLFEKPTFSIDGGFGLAVESDGLTAAIVPGSAQPAVATLVVSLGDLRESIELQYLGDGVEAPADPVVAADNVPASLVLSVSDIVPAEGVGEAPAEVAAAPALA
jgi:hypothetical protein